MSTVLEFRKTCKFQRKQKVIYQGQICEVEVLPYSIEDEYLIRFSNGSREFVMENELKETGPSCAAYFDRL